MLLHLIWVQTLVVETKGIPLEQISAQLGAPRDLVNPEPATKVVRY
jgi:hypothetical protein